MCIRDRPHPFKDKPKPEKGSFLKPSTIQAAISPLANIKTSFNIIKSVSYTHLIYMQKIQAFLNLMTMKKEREEREGKEYV